MTPNPTSLWQILARAFIQLFVAGAFIGSLHQYDTTLAALLFVMTFLFYKRSYDRKPSIQRAIVLLSGALLTGLIGVLGEHWGIDRAHWVYHDLADGRSFARWLPFAWILAFVYLYNVEERLIRHFNISNLKQKIVLIITISATLPTLGEIFAIYFGVWSYRWDYQLLGVPLLAILLLVAIHTTVFVVLTIFCRKYQINDTVFGYRGASSEIAASSLERSEQ